MFLKRNLVKNFVAVTVMAIFIGNASIMVHAQTSTDESENILINGESVSIEDAVMYNEGEVIINPSNARITSTGRFTFDVGYSVTSESFMVNDTETTITLRATIEGPYGADVTASYPDHRYQIILYKDGILNTKVNESYFYANGTEYEFTCVGLDTSAKYYFVIYNTDYLPEGTTVVGEGTISNFSKVAD